MVETQYRSDLPGDPADNHPPCRQLPNRPEAYTGAAGAE
jgi:hypothetical protein